MYVVLDKIYSRAYVFIVTILYNSNDTIFFFDFLLCFQFVINSLLCNDLKFCFDLASTHISDTLKPLFELRTVVFFMKENVFVNFLF